MYMYQEFPSSHSTTDSSAYSSIRSITDIPSSSSTLLPGYFSSADSLQSTGTSHKTSDSVLERGKVTEQRTIKEVRDTPPSKPPRLFRARVFSPDIDSNDEDTIFMRITSEETEYDLNSSNDPRDRGISPGQDTGERYFN